MSIDAMAAATRPAPGTKTKTAFDELVVLLRAIVSDREVSPSEVEDLVRWRIKHKTVLGRQRLKPFAEWLEAALADGVIDAQERDDLIEWCNRLGGMADADAEAEFQETQAAEAIWQRPPKATPKSDWRQDPATERQRGFLVELGVPWEASANYTKGQASAIITRKIEERDAQRAEKQAELLAAALRRQQGVAPTPAAAKAGCLIFLLLGASGLVASIMAWA